MLTDKLMGFWHQFVRPSLTAINSGFGAEVYDQYVQRRFSEYMGGAFESICLDYARLHLAEILGSPAREVGGIWGHANFDIDVAGRLLDETFFYGECKWLTAKIDMGMLQTLLDRSEMTSYGGDRPAKQYLLFGRNGCKPDVVEHVKTDASIHIIGPAELTFAPMRELAG